MTPPHEHRAGDLDTVHAIVAARLRDDGQRYTANRRALVEALAGSDGPLTLPDVLTRCAGLPQSSAYRGLAVLERAGAVHRVASSDEFARFELVEDLTGHHHHHLICSSCGKVDDFTVPGHLEQSLDAELAAAARKAGFTPDRHRLDLVGRCRECA
jgi:Fe2+ or Zn2+ uptake regulation protein